MKVISRQLNAYDLGFGPKHCSKSVERGKIVSGGSSMD